MKTFSDLNSGDSIYYVDEYIVLKIQVKISDKTISLQLPPFVNSEWRNYDIGKVAKQTTINVRIRDVGFGPYAVNEFFCCNSEDVMAILEKTNAQNIKYIKTQMDKLDKEMKSENTNYNKCLKSLVQ